MIDRRQFLKAFGFTGALLIAPKALCSESPGSPAWLIGFNATTSGNRSVMATVGVSRGMESVFERGVNEFGGSLLWLPQYESYIVDDGRLQVWSNSPRVLARGLFLRHGRYEIEDSNGQKWIANE